MSALTADMRAAVDKARAFDPRPEVVEMWNEIEELADTADDPAGALIAFCQTFTAAALGAFNTSDG